MKEYSNKITRFQYMYIIQGSMIGVGLISLPYAVSNIAKQSGWISVLLCGIYPLYVTLAACTIYKNMNYINFVELNTQLYGKILSILFIFIFFTYFSLIAIFTLSGFINILVFSTTKFLSPYLIIIITVFLVYLTINEGSTNLGRISEFLFPLTLFIILIPFYFINKGNRVNLLPIISDYKSIFAAMPTALFSYSGVEISLLIIPFISDKKKIKLFSSAGSSMTIFIYTVVVLLVINYCGFKLTSKLQYPFLYLVSSAEFPVISDFEPLFLFLWGNKIFQTISSMAFGASYTMTKVLNISYNKCCILGCTVTAAISCFFIPEYNRSEAIDKILPYFVIFSLLWLTISLFFSFMRRGVVK
ncbi:GerAB/ArcD/ProY family transporter [Clostridium thermarum]|uniref:GerAB/ArcD/ProY family transporter n=1 Tax=Clostridium thermarum TaxID=1716543 RepID=UPI001123AB16|nr:GerAB/ArcD/ProY family transporter [Clostridium thermarum]